MWPSQIVRALSSISLSPSIVQFRTTFQFSRARRGAYYFQKNSSKKCIFCHLGKKKIYVGDFDWFTPLTEKPIIEALNIQKKFDEKGRNMIWLVTTFLKYLTYCSLNQALSSFVYNSCIYLVLISNFTYYISTRYT